MIRRRRRRGQRGFTLIELMVSLVLFSFMIAGLFSMALSMMNGYREQRAAVGTEAAARSAMDYMADSMRQVSPATNSGAITVVDLAACPTETLLVTNSSVGPDRLMMLFAYGSYATTALPTAPAVAYTAGTTSLDVGNAESIAVNDYVVISDGVAAVFVQVIGKVNGPTGLGNTLQFAVPLCATPPVVAAGAVVIRALRAEFFIAMLDGVPTLWMDPDTTLGPAAAEPLAEGIEDMQIAQASDSSVPPDNLIFEQGAAINDDEWSYNVAGDALVAGPVRALRISFVGRALAQVTGTGKYKLPAVEDRPQGATADGYRRRVLTSIVEIRNLGGSP